MIVSDPFGTQYEDTVAHLITKEGRVFQILQPDQTDENGNLLPAHWDEAATEAAFHLYESSNSLVEIKSVLAPEHVLPPI